MKIQKEEMALEKSPDARSSQPDETSSGADRIRSPHRKGHDLPNILGQSAKAESNLGGYALLFRSADRFCCLINANVLESLGHFLPLRRGGVSVCWGVV